MPPPKRRRDLDTAGKNNGQSDEPDQDKEGSNEDQRDRGDGDGEEGPALQPIEGEESEEESDEEYESALEDPWPDDIWNENIEKRTQEEAQVALKQRNTVGGQWTKHYEKTRIAMRLDGPGFIHSSTLPPSCACHPNSLATKPPQSEPYGYQLFALGYEVWQFEGISKVEFCHKPEVLLRD